MNKTDLTLDLTLGIPFVHVSTCHMRVNMDELNRVNRRSTERRGERVIDHWMPVKYREGPSSPKGGHSPSGSGSPTLPSLLAPNPITYRTWVQFRFG